MSGAGGRWVSQVRPKGPGGVGVPLCVMGGVPGAGLGRAVLGLAAEGALLVLRSWAGVPNPGGCLTPPGAGTGAPVGQGSDPPRGWGQAGTGPPMGWGQSHLWGWGQGHWWRWDPPAVPGHGSVGAQGPGGARGLPGEGSRLILSHGCCNFLPSVTAGSAFPTARTGRAVVRQRRAWGKTPRQMS